MENKIIPKYLMVCFHCNFKHPEDQMIRTNKGFLCSNCKSDPELDYMEVKFYPICSICGSILRMPGIQETNKFTGEIECYTELKCYKCNKEMRVD